MGVAKAGDSSLKNAHAFIQALVKLQSQVKIPQQLDAVCETHIPQLAADGIKEALAYPVRHFFSQREAELLLRRLIA